ncbi:MAG: hypothetical protein NXI31_18645 [bacterium]|nr:hypothetical protein [bacterium]
MKHGDEQGCEVPSRLQRWTDATYSALGGFAFGGVVGFLLFGIGAQLAGRLDPMIGFDPIVIAGSFLGGLGGAALCIRAALWEPRSRQ